MKDNCFIEFCCFLSNLNMNQPSVQFSRSLMSAIGIHILPPFWTSLPSPSPSHPSRLIQSPCLSFLSQGLFSFKLLFYRNMTYMKVILYLHTYIKSFKKYLLLFGLFSSVIQLCPTLWNPMDCSTPGFPGHHHLP